MADAHLADQPLHVLLQENVGDEAVTLPQEDVRTFAGDDTGRVLTTMLQDRQRIVELLIDRRFRYDADDAAH
jgi:hypothetical protein